MFILLTLHVRIELKTSEHLFNIKFRNIKHMFFFSNVRMKEYTGLVTPLEFS